MRSHLDEAIGGARRQAARGNRGRLRRKASSPRSPFAVPTTEVPSFRRS